MKKWIIFGVALLGLASFQTVHAEGIQAGKAMISLYGGLTMGLQDSGLNFADKDFAWGHVGGEIGLSGLYFLTEYFGIGADIRYAGFAGSDKEVWDRRSLPYHKHRLDMDMNTFHLMALTRVNLNPYNQVRFYIPFGAGLTVATGRLKYQFDDWYNIDASATNASFGYFAGLGVEYDMQDGAMAVGFETRYTAFRYDMNRLTSRIDVEQRPGKENYSYLSFLITLSFK